MTAPYQPSILDRVIGRLFPTAQYTGLLSPDAQRSVQQQGLLGLGTSLLQAGAPHPYQMGTLGNLGGALQQSQMSFPQMAEHALQIQAYQSQVAQQQAIAQVAAKHPAVQGETPQQRYDRQLAMVTDLMTIPGGAAIAEKYAPVLAATKPDKATAPREPMRIPDTRDNVIGSPTHGLVGTTLLDPDTHQRVGFVPQEQKPTARAAAASMLAGQEARAAAQRLLESHLTGSQLEQQNVVPSTAAAAIGGVVQKIAGEKAGQGVTTALRGSNTNAEQQAAGRWADAYLSLTPKGRAGSPALRDQIIRTYWPGEGDTQATVALKATARKAATAALVRAVATGTAPGLPGFEPEPSAP